MQKNRLGQETSARRGSGEPVASGSPRRCQLAPSKRSAIRPFPQLPVAWQNRTTGQSTVERPLPGEGRSGGRSTNSPARCGARPSPRTGPGKGRRIRRPRRPGAVRTGHVTERNALGAFGLRRGLLPPGVDAPEPALDEGRASRPPGSSTGRRPCRCVSADTRRSTAGCCPNQWGSGWTARASRCRPSARQACECSARWPSCRATEPTAVQARSPEQETSSSVPPGTPGSAESTSSSRPRARSAGRADCRQRSRRSAAGTRCRAATRTDWGSA